VRRLEYRSSVQKCINNFIDVFVEQTKQIWYFFFGRRHATNFSSWPILAII
jgi:hypothetical protein